MLTSNLPGQFNRSRVFFAGSCDPVRLSGVGVCDVAVVPTVTGESRRSKRGSAPLGQERQEVEYTDLTIAVEVLQTPVAGSPLREQREKIEDAHASVAVEIRRGIVGVTGTIL